MSVWQAFFGWPAGGVWANLVASVLGFTVHHVLMRRHHANTTARQTKELKAHIDTAIGGQRQ